MRSMLRAIVLTSAALCATAAFAANKAVVSVPFNFESHGVAFPAGKYSASLDLNKNILTFRNIGEPSQSITWIVTPADATDIPAPLLVKFDDFGTAHELRTVQLGSRITPRLDAPAKHHDAGSLVAAVSGQ